MRSGTRQARERARTACHTGRPASCRRCARGDRLRSLAPRRVSRGCKFGSTTRVYARTTQCGKHACLWELFVKESGWGGDGGGGGGGGGGADGVWV